MNKVIIDVKDIMGDVGAEKHYVFEQEFDPIKTEATEIKFTEPVKYDIKVENTGSGVRVKGSAKSTLELLCGRCLKEFDFGIDWKVNELFYSGEPPEEGAYRMQDTKIDLGPATEEEFVLAIPMKPLCEESCRGLCPTCGEPITAEHKPHDEEHIDARFEILKKLLVEQPKEK